MKCRFSHIQDGCGRFPSEISIRDVERFIGSQKVTSHFDFSALWMWKDVELEVSAGVLKSSEILNVKTTFSLLVST